MPQIHVSLPDDNQITFDLTDDKITVGRLADNRIHIEDGSVSSHHAELTLLDGRYHLHDLGSTNGTFVNDEQVTDAVLKNGDRVRFGQIPAQYHAVEETGASQPLPEASTTTLTESAQSSARPATFASTSPVPREVTKKDTVGIALYAGAGVAIAAFAAAIYFIVSLHTGA